MMVRLILPLLFAAAPSHAQEMWGPVDVPPAELTAADTLYAGAEPYDPYRVIRLEAAPTELASIYADLDARTPPLRIYSYSRDTPQGLKEPMLRSSFVHGSAEARLSDFIRRFEAGRGDYDAVWAGSKVPLPAPPTQMTLCQVRDWQKRARRVQTSTAIGRYQVVSGTLKGVVEDLGLGCSVLFDAETQDTIALELFNRRGWAEFRDGSLSAEDFAFELAGEWAALPASKGPDKGRSRYWRIAGNRHLVELPEYLAFLATLRLGELGPVARQDRVEEGKELDDGALRVVAFSADR